MPWAVNGIFAIKPASSIWAAFAGNGIDETTLTEWGIFIVENVTNTVVVAFKTILQTVPVQVKAKVVIGIVPVLEQRLPIEENKAIVADQSILQFVIALRKYGLPGEGTL